MGGGRTGFGYGYSHHAIVSREGFNFYGGTTMACFIGWNCLCDKSVLGSGGELWLGDPFTDVVVADGIIVVDVDDVGADVVDVDTGVVIHEITTEIMAETFTWLGHSMCLLADGITVVGVDDVGAEVDDVDASVIPECAINEA